MYLYLFLKYRQHFDKKLKQTITFRDNRSTPDCSIPSR